MGRSRQIDYVPPADFDITAVGNAGTGEDDLVSEDLPANTLAEVGKMVRIIAWGTGANNANTKTVRVYIGSTAVVSLGLLANSAQVWKAEIILISTGTDTQKYIAEGYRQSGSLVLIAVMGSDVLAEDDSAAITVKATGEATADDDIVCEGIIFEDLN